MQHPLWTQLFGYHANPKIPLRYGADLQVADLGTGTGQVINPLTVSKSSVALVKAVNGHALMMRSARIWLSDLSSQLPATAQLDGLDISFKAAPPTEWLPSNIKLRHWDIRDPIPEHLVDKYDFVHLRFFLCVLRNDEMSTAVENIAKLISKTPSNS